MMRLNILQQMRSQLLERTSIKDLPELVWKRSGALNTWGTNAIEGSTIGRKDAEKLLLDDTTPAGKPVKDVRETLQHQEAFRELPEYGKINMENILEMHETVFRGTLEDAGQWRRVNVRITGAKFTPPRMEKVREEISRWVDEYHQRDLEGDDVFTLAAWMHYELERVHPFADGNGRIGRLLLNLHFINRNWPPVHVLPAHRNKYIDSLNDYADGDTKSLEDFLKIRMGASLLDLLDQLGTAEDEMISLKDAETPYEEKYLALRCKQGEIPALKEGREWRVSKRALRLYTETVGRK